MTVKGNEITGKEIVLGTIGALLTVLMAMVGFIASDTRESIKDVQKDVKTLGEDVASLKGSTAYRDQQIASFALEHNDLKEELRETKDLVIRHVSKDR